MSKIIDSTEQNPVDEPVFDLKAAVPIEEIPVDQRKNKTFTYDDIEELAEILAEKYNKYDPIQIVSKKNVPIVDFTTLNRDDIFDPNINIEVKPFMPGDMTKVDLVDKNYEPRWVNKKSERLGYMLSNGFTYVEPKDLSTRLEVEIGADANGHFVYNDVVLMKVPKSIYYPALRANHLKAQNAINAQKNSARQVSEANGYMLRAVGGQYAEARQANQVEFYRTNNANN